MASHTTRTGSPRGWAHREAAWKVEASARFCADPTHAARLRALAAWHQWQADRLDSRETFDEVLDADSA